MPSKSEKQRRFMEKACSDPEFAKAHNIDQKVACEFVEADHKAAHQKKEKEENSKPAFAKWKDKK